jgi:hypothetical protein
MAAGRINAGYMKARPPWRTSAATDLFGADDVPRWHESGEAADSGTWGVDSGKWPTQTKAYR